MQNDIKKRVRDAYAKIAGGERHSCCGPASGCCGSSTEETIGRKIGYLDSEMASVPDGSNLGLGCGNPVALASLRPGETVVDLGSGAGFDSFLTAQRVGPEGRIIGIDMTPAMIDKAKRNAAAGGYANVEFRLGEIESIPLPDGTADVVISNCVINLSPDKASVFREAFRILKPGGRMMISDIVLLAPLPDAIRASIEAYIGCIAGALLRDDYLAMIRAAGFGSVTVHDESAYDLAAVTGDAALQSGSPFPGLTASDLRNIGQSVISLKVSALKSHTE